MSFSTNIIKFERMKNVIFLVTFFFYLRKMPQDAILKVVRAAVDTTGSHNNNVSLQVPVKY